MRVAVIGAGGFVGAEVLRQLSALPQITAIHGIDRVPVASQGKVTGHLGDFADPALRETAFDVDAVIHLAAILGGAAEQDYALSRKVNIDATLDLIQHVRDTAPKTRFVFASTIAVYGKPLPDPVTDATPLHPAMIYGAQKLMIEVALSNFARRGQLDAVSLRPSGVMARDGADAALKSAFISRLFYAVRRGEDITLPVAADSRTWLTSVRNVASNFVHGVILPDLGKNRAFTLPALAITYGELVVALRRRFPGSRSAVTFQPDPDTVALFGQSPGLVTKTADALGFTRDADADALVAAAIVCNLCCKLNTMP